VKAALDKNKYYCFNSINSMICKDVSNKFILGVLNSRLINWYYSTCFSNNSNLTVNISTKLLKQLPIPNFPVKAQEALISMVDEINLITSEIDYVKNIPMKQYLLEKKLINYI
jgi:hypothetical protein